METDLLLDINFNQHYDTMRKFTSEMLQNTIYVLRLERVAKALQSCRSCFILEQILRTSGESSERSPNGRRTQKTRKETYTYITIALPARRGTEEETRFPQFATS